MADVKFNCIQQNVLDFAYSCHFRNNEKYNSLGAWVGKVDRDGDERHVEQVLIHGVRIVNSLMWNHNLVTMLSILHMTAAKEGLTVLVFMSKKPLVPSGLVKVEKEISKVVSIVEESSDDSEDSSFD